MDLAQYENRKVTVQQWTDTIKIKQEELYEQNFNAD